MAKLACFTIPGIELWFFSHDHLPPHFHAKRRGQWEIRVFFLESSANEMFKVVRPKGKEISKGDLELLEAKVKAFRAEILEEWERKVLPQ
jgi:Domain of unknown function (DUF4160)